MFLMNRSWRKLPMDTSCRWLLLLLDFLYRLSTYWLLLFFFLANRRSTYFVRWHCTQALLSQFSLFLVNTVGFWWTLSVLFREDVEISNPYIAYIATVLCFNIGELVLTIYTAIKTRKGEHISWWFYGPLTNLICKS